MDISYIGDDVFTCKKTSAVSKVFIVVAVWASLFHQTKTNSEDTLHEDEI